jgi:hypothetical protein
MVKNKSKLIASFLFLFLSLISTYIYLNNLKTSFLRVPVTFDRAAMPVLEIKIEETIFSVKLDLGSKFQMTLSEPILDSLDKTSYETAYWRDVRGNFYEAPSFSIPKITIGNRFALENFIAVQKDVGHQKNTTIWDDGKNISDPVLFGSLGRPLLEKTNLLLDFPHSAIFFCNDRKDLKKAGFSLENMIQVPLEITPKGMIIKTETDQGVLNLLIDTCASISFVRSSHLQSQEYPKEKHGFEVFTSSQFIIEGKDFGEQQFFLYDITPELHELDGALGMDFLKKHVVYIDYSNKVVFIERGS